VINLIQNSLDALNGRPEPQILLTAFENESHVELIV
jgi:C4-dicarboxylate-specific signal transduction histidine kinase